MDDFQKEVARIICEEKLCFASSLRVLDNSLVSMNLEKDHVQKIVSLKQGPFRTKNVIEKVAALLDRIKAAIANVEHQSHVLEGQMGTEYERLVDKTIKIETHVTDLLHEATKELELVRKYCQEAIATSQLFRADFMLSDEKIEKRKIYHSEPETGVYLLQHVVTSLAENLRFIAIHLHVEALVWAVEKQNLANAYLERNTKELTLVVKLAFERIKPRGYTFTFSGPEKRFNDSSINFKRASFYLGIRKVNPYPETYHYFVGDSDPRSNTTGKDRSLRVLELAWYVHLKDQSYQKEGKVLLSYSLPENCFKAHIVLSKDSSFQMAQGPKEALVGAINSINATGALGHGN